MSTQTNAFGLHRRIIAIDVLMIVLLIINLSWLGFDWLFANRTVNHFVEEVSPHFHDFYANNIHDDLAKIDIFFVAIFLFEFLMRWINSVRRKEYRSWYFYPILHWYDVLGLIPVGYLRILRFFRIFSITYRLQRMGVINLKKTILWEKFIFFKDLIVEEITDRVIVNLLQGVQKEIREGNPTGSNIAEKIVAPHKDELVLWVKNKVRSSAEQHYVPHREYIKNKIAANVAQVMDNNESVDQLERIPVVGKAISRQLESIIADAIFNTLDSVVQTFALDENNKSVEEITATLLDSALESGDPDVKLQSIIQQITLAALDEVIANVERKQWQVQQQEAEALGVN